MPIERQKWITRADLRANPDKVYVFGDNMERRGLGGQAKEMRGEPNAIGVATKIRPDMREDSFFTDDQRYFKEVADDLGKVWAMLQLGKTVVVPADGIGTGLSELPQRAPKLNAQIEELWRQAEIAFPER